MTDDRIPPALTPDEWEIRGKSAQGWAPRERVGVRIDDRTHLAGAFALDRWIDGTDLRETVEVMRDSPVLPAVIAFANELLPDDSPYKITREKIEAVMVAARLTYPIGSASYREIAGFVDGLAALLPPEGL